MTPAKTLAALALLALAPDVAGQSIERVDVEHVFATDSADFTPGVMQRAFTGAEVLVGSNIGVSQDLPGVETEVEFVGFCTRSLRVEAIALANGGTYFDAAERWGSSAAGGSWTWGWCNNCGSENFTLSASTSLGQTYTLLGTAPGTWFDGHEYAVEGSAGGDVTVIMSLNIDIEAKDAAGVPLDMLVTDIAVDVEVDLTVTATRTLHLAPTVNYCTSQANGLGVHGALEAYGSDEAGSLWLTLRTRDVPENSAGILFMGTDIVSVPGSTTTLCVGGSLQRVGGVQVVRNGYADFNVDLLSFLPGDTARFQCFHRDPVVGVAATDAFALTVQ